MTTSAYQYTTKLREIWRTAVAKYQAGDRGSESYFDPEQTEFLASIGHTAQEVYDFAEDYVNYGEPDWETFVLIAQQRRHHYLNVLNQRAPERVIDTGDLPPKTEAVRGIEWLPRLIAKAKAKLNGEMSSDLMYGCGGDRKFFKQHNIHPAEFLQVVAGLFDHDEAVVEWVEQHSKQA